MKKETKTMVLSEFIEKMKKGWGFYRPYQVKRAGKRLEEIFSGSEALTKRVDVTYTSAPYGSEHYYNWTVKGVGLPTGKTEILKPGTPDVIFGSTIDGLPALIHQDVNSFSVHFDN